MSKLEHTLKDVENYIQKTALSQKRPAEEVFELLMTKEYLDYAGVSVSELEKEEICKNVNAVLEETLKEQQKSVVPKQEWNIENVADRFQGMLEYIERFKDSELFQNMSNDCSYRVAELQTALTNVLDEIEMETEMELDDLEMEM